ncbi:hypothetical protein Xcel_0825 [Xylanimonas cellulosilytica DSM 15894]|uniref:Uncharacterized protein n=1 Tax=Xylanimonas cellulosilytica (strain DSM 15894 / JCM 12276 / CECT 5975 / KCTC 9989 / LMG 20990 / NBRC 107835 / XIL07) TaxID=446471 RepID=D1BY17_XYLCX|nr:hypothetical protein [Xylanimonas cellulosilytica]ACZ29860.1 hypothetical protein Xcel_0825 [Xylanimonas cellulosilytica DSM 15894]
MLTATRPTRRNVLLTGGAVLVLGAGLAGLLHAADDGGTSPRQDALPTATTEVNVPPATQERTPATEPAPLPPVTDAEQFARNVASALFDWDTTGGTPLAEHRGRLLAVADPTGVESPGLVSDLTMYLPTEDTWARLRQYGTRQWIEVSSVVAPTLWAQAVAQSGDGFAAGTTAYTVTGVRHRTGVDDGEPVHVQFDVTFTVFAVCEPTYPQCYLLRLSQLDNPLR